MSTFRKFSAEEKKTFTQVLKTKGWFIAPSFIVDETLLVKAKEALRVCSDNCRNIQIKNKIPDNNEGTTHHLVGQDPIFLEILKGLAYEFNDIFEEFFSGKYILNALGGNFLDRGVKSYASEIHRDVRTFSLDLNLMINTLVMFDDFTEENGATYLLSNSQTQSEKPSKEEFYKNAERATGKKGSVIFWHSNLWHAAGANSTNQERTSVTPMFTKPFMKQQFDYVNVVGTDNVANMDDELTKQVLGYYSRVPRTLDDWYQPKESRFYHPNQE